MNKKGQKDQKGKNSLNKFLTKSNPPQENSSVSTVHKNEGKKKVCFSLNDFVTTKEKPPLPPPLPRKIQLHQLLKDIDAEQLMKQCPKLQQLIHFLSSKVGLPLDLVSSIFKKYLLSAPQSLWSRKYAPKQISQLFNISAGMRIKDWINAFFEYKNKICDQDSFLNDGESSKQCKIYQNIRQNQWQLLALIVRGRPGIGKTSAIRAVAKEMSIDLQECGNEYNQTKYLREKNESTQSQSVKAAYIKKTKVERNAQMITKFMPPLEKEKPKENKKTQMIHNISIIHPVEEALKFYHELSRCVELSKIPFIMTNSGEKLPKECQKYDIIQFQEGSSERVDQILWVIYHFESLLLLNTAVEVKEEQVFEEIAHQIVLCQIKQLCSVDKIRDICILFSYRLDYIFTFLEHHRKNIASINVFPLLIDKYKHLNEDQLLEQILFIDFQKMRLANLTLHSLDKTEDNNNTQDSSESQKTKDQKQISLATYRQHVDLAALEDTVGDDSQIIPFRKHTFDVSEWENYPYTCIDVRIHRGIKDSLVKIVNTEANSSCERVKSSLKISQLSYLPMLMRQKRAGRGSRISVDYLKRLFSDNELCYLQNFGHLLKPE